MTDLHEGYAKDLAYVHDDGFGGFAREAAPGVLRLLAASEVRDGLVVDLGCGSGIWAAELLGTGYEVLGIDQSAAMLELARGRAPGGRFELGSAFDVELPSCDAITALGEVLSYAFDPRAGRQAQAALFTRARAALRRGGALVFDVVVPVRGGVGSRTWTEGDDWVVCVDAVQHEDRRSLTRSITTFRAADGAWRRSDEEHRLVLSDPQEVLDDLDAAGFHARRLDAYGDLRLRPGVTAFLATTRPSTM